MKCLAVSSGGTAGHINPALSIARKLAEKNWQIHYLGNRNSLEEQLLAKTDFTFHELNVQKLYRRFTFAHAAFPFKLIKSINLSKKIYKLIKPDVFLGCGGFVSGPPGYAAHLMHIPIILQEQNSYPGLTTRLLAKYSNKIFLGNKKAEQYLKEAVTEYSGNPINSFPALNLPHYGDHNSKQKTVFLLGGSQGSQALNKVMLSICRELLANGINLIWQTGKNNYVEILNKTGRKEGLILFDFSTQINEFYSKADIIIARAGALTLAELETLRKPAILIPLPSSAENHQLYNAQEQAEKGIAEVLEQKDLTPESLLKQVNAMLNNLEAYRSRFKNTLHSAAAEHIAAFIDANYGS
ncbi:MAG: undecaprenyldiphospho-muramoylpentapeptide beta-N-acetylglucosaminyltransferase [Candidatus Cloacimonetes bacterium]|nr:undecaprenyldiphospho-muramoylpentapeptide beta-N-acetylglucosaminyltransferase [Candidatus Cloacimonadota bacterium]